MLYYLELKSPKYIKHKAVKIKSGRIITLVKNGNIQNVQKR